MNLPTVLKLALSAVIAAVCFACFCAVRHSCKEKPDDKKLKKKKRLLFWGMMIALWFFVGSVINVITGRSGSLHIEFEMFSERVMLGGLSVAKTTIVTWVIIAVVLVLSLLFRFVAFPRFKAEPKGLQNVMELAVESVDKLCSSNIEEPFASSLSPYMMSVAVFLVGCAASELFGQRPPSADLIVNLSLSLVTFALINICSIRKKGLGGRIKSMASPSPVIFPMKIISDIAVPVSLACRLFGNMLGGMIVMDLLKGALGGYAVGLTSLAGLYFNLFHPLIQTYIFVVLSLTFINEAVENPE